MRILYVRIHELVLTMPQLAGSEHTELAYIAGNESRDATFIVLANLGAHLVSGALGSSMNAFWEGRVVVAGE